MCKAEKKKEVQKLFLMFRQNLLCSSLCSLPLILLLGTVVKEPGPILLNSFHQVFLSIDKINSHPQALYSSIIHSKAELNTFSLVSDIRETPLPCPACFSSLKKYVTIQSCKLFHHASMIGMKSQPCDTQISSSFSLFSMLCALGTTGKK